MWDQGNDACTPPDLPPALTMPFSPSTSQVRLWICRRDSFISCLASRSASWLRLAASERSANWGGARGVRAVRAPWPPHAPPALSYL